MNIHLDDMEKPSIFLSRRSFSKGSPSELLPYETGRTGLKKNAVLYKPQVAKMRKKACYLIGLLFDTDFDSDFDPDSEMKQNTGFNVKLTEFGVGIEIAIEIEKRPLQDEAGLVDRNKP